MSIANQQNPKSKNHCLIFDPIPFSGGSKIATKEAIYQSDHNKISYTVLSVSPSCWNDDSLKQKHSVSVFPLYCPKKLLLSSYSWTYWLKQLFFCISIALLLARTSKVDVALGASGPGVDMALYLCRKLFGYRLLQLIHGPVGLSRSIGYCLTQADTTFYLSSSQKSMTDAMAIYFDYKFNTHKYKYPQSLGADCARFNLASPHYYRFENGISTHKWPTPCMYGEPTIFWAASLLEWKGLDTLVEAGRLLAKRISILSRICYIRPSNTQLELSTAPVELKNCEWYEQPRNLDELRSKSNIFVSTSRNEPFGLSILEAIASGMCVVIPKDGSYWDKKLKHNVNCIKYKPGCAASLADALLLLALHPLKIEQLGLSARNIADHYHASHSYLRIAQSIVERAPHRTQGSFSNGL